MESAPNKPEGVCQNGTCENPGTHELHPCPYRVDVQNDATPCCNCCAGCQHECAMDV